MYKSDKIVCILSLTLIIFIVIGFTFLNNYTAINAKKDYKVIVIVKTTLASVEFWKSYVEGVKTAADEFNISYKVEGTPSETMTSEQIDILNRAIAEKPDAILLSAIDYKLLAPSAKKAVAAGITLITTDSDVDYSGKASFVATNNIEVGKKLGQLLDSHIGTSSKYLIIEHFANTETAVDRVKGALSSIKNSKERLIGTFSCGSSTLTAKNITINQLNLHPEIKGIIATNEISALGVAEAIKQMGLSGKVCVVCCDSSIELIKYMEEGVVQNFVVQRPFNMGYLGMKFVNESLHNVNVPSSFDTGSIVVNAGNLYTSENQKLLFPFN